MNIRIAGLPAGVTQTLQAIQQTRTLDVIQVNGPYPNRSHRRLVHGCIQAQLHPDKGAVP
jgi:hypothetical protein